MPKHHFDDLSLGETLSCKPFSFSEEQVLRFCNEYDPQYFHIDPERAKTSHFGGLIASGWQTAAMVLNAFITEHLHFEGGVTGLGIDGLRWKAPVYPGDALTPSATITEKRLSNSRPGWGITTCELTLTNQNGVTVLTMRTSMIIEL